MFIIWGTKSRQSEQIYKQRSFEYDIARRMAQPALLSGESPPIAPASGQADQRLLAALQTLGTLDARNRDVIQFRERLQRWDYLTPSEREVLLHEIDSFVTEDRKVNSVIHFMKMLSTPTPNWISCLGCLTGMAVAVVGFATLPFLQSWLWGPLFVVFSMVLWFFAQMKATDRAVRVWVRRVLIPMSYGRDVDMRYFVGLLSGIKGNTGGYEERIADMARNVDVIADELLKQGHLTLEGEAQTTTLSAAPAQSEILPLTPVPTEESP